MDKVVHILHSGVGGQAGVVFPLVGESMHEVHPILAFYGVDPLATQNRAECLRLNLPHTYIQKCPGLGLGSQLKLAGWILAHEPDVIIAHSPATLVASIWIKVRRPRTKIIAVEHHSNALKTRKHWLMSALALWVTDRVVYLSEPYRAAVANKLGGALFRDSRTVVIPNGLDLMDFECPTDHALSEQGALTIGMQGRMVAGKDFESLLHGFSALLQGRGRDDGRLRLELAGDGVERRALEQLATSLGIEDKVVFLGMLSQASLIKRMRQWKIFVLSSAGETMSMAVMEAMALGLPILATDVPGVSDLIQHDDTGLLVPFQRPDAIANALAALIRSPMKQEELGRNARRYAQHNFSVARSWGQYRQLICNTKNRSATSNSQKRTTHPKIA